jgi:hypothetical protein
VSYQRISRRQRCEKQGIVKNIQIETSSGVSPETLFVKAFNNSESGKTIAVE